MKIAGLAAGITALIMQAVPFMSVPAPPIVPEPAGARFVVIHIPSQAP